MGVPSIRNTLIMTFNFHPWAHAAQQIKNLHKTKSDQHFIFYRGPFYEIFWNGTGLVAVNVP